MTCSSQNLTEALLARGVEMPAPDSVTVSPDVDPERICAGTTLHPGCRLSGATLSIGPGCEIGREAPATVRDCQLGAHVNLAGGFFEGSVFLDDVSIGASSHVRPGCLLEEQATCGHAVGLKQTLLMPFVTTGSLINFCDCAMAGGTSRKNHSEVGSSYVHFNFSPNQDKATASLMGDVPHGVMLDQAPIFLGGQGGLVGPTRVAYGTVVAAGSILRRDALTPGQLIAPAAPVVDRPFDPRVHPNPHRKSENNRLYIANLCALHEWYGHVRSPLAAGRAHAEICVASARDVISGMIAERLKRAAAWVEIVPDGASRGLKDAWAAIAHNVNSSAYADRTRHEREAFLAATGAPGNHSGSYLDFIHTLPLQARRLGTAWLQAIVDAI